MNRISSARIARALVLGLLIFITSCSPQIVIVQQTSEPSLPTQGSNPTDTASAPTVPVQTPTFAAATATSLPATVVQTEAAQTTDTSAPALTACQDSAKYIRDDGLDGTTYASNTPFTKTWTVKNTGSCTWDNNYLVAQISGPFMTQQPGYLFVPQGQTVAPGQTVNISVGMTSPVENGNYKSYWGLEKRDGPLMPIKGGTNGNSFFVEINVNNGAGDQAGNVTGASIDIEPEQGSGPACTADSTYFVHASLTADGPATASYEISSTAGQIAAGNFQDLSNNELTPTVAGSVVFDQADTKTVDLRFVGPYPYPQDITVVLRVNGGEFYNTKLPCP